MITANEVMLSFCFIYCMLWMFIYEEIGYYTLRNNLVLIIAMVGLIFFTLCLAVGIVISTETILDFFIKITAYDVRGAQHFS
jgi:hypothetical protein